MGIHASDGSGWSSENDPFGGNDNSGKGTGPEGNEYLKRNPVAAAEHKLSEAKKVLDTANQKVKDKQGTLNNLKSSAEGLALTNPVANPITFSRHQFISVPAYSGGGVNFETTVTINSLNNLNLLLRDGANSYVNNVLKWGDVTASTPDGLKVGNGI